MSNYLIDTMVWSHSRLSAYRNCPYGFYLKYISGLEEVPMFFSEYGSLIHGILADYHSGAASKSEALTDYLIRFATEARGVGPSDSIRMSYFKSGMDCMKALSPIDGRVLGIEEKVSFQIESKPFVGFVDMIYEDNDSALCVLDHKSRALKPRSKRKKPTKTDIELDEYLRQLYLYSIPVREAYGRYPDFLEFNCYRTGVRIRERFDENALEETKRFTLDTIDEIGREKDWNPDLDFWKCRCLCGYCDQCEYAQMAEWRS